MSLIVEVTSDGAFEKLVLAALTDLCGCQSVAIDAITGKVSVGAMVCSCYCDHRAGCNLLSDVINDARTIPIYYTEDGSGWSNDEIQWNPRDKHICDPDVCGGTLLTGSIALGHELVHALHPSWDHHPVIRGENQLRRERCMPMRTGYDCERYDDFRVGALDASIRPEYGCTCSFLRGGILKFFQRWWCALHSMYCFPTRFIVRRKPS